MGEKTGNTPPDLPTAPAAERNKAPILEVLRACLPPRGLVLEVACGTGQHACHFAAALPALEWLPTDPDPAAVETTATRVRQAALPNLRLPARLDVHDQPWPVTTFDALVCINLLHISPWTATRALFVGAAAGLSEAGTLVVYGPFRFDGRHTAASNEAFDRQLRQRDSRWGVRDVEAVREEAAHQGFVLHGAEAMPANNYCLIWRRGHPAQR